jgi:hypothetical protein
MESAHMTKYIAGRDLPDRPIGLMDHLPQDVVPLWLAIMMAVNIAAALLVILVA